MFVVVPLALVYICIPNSYLLVLDKMAMLYPLIVSVEEKSMGLYAYFHTKLLSWHKPLILPVDLLFLHIFSHNVKGNVSLNS